MASIPPRIVINRKISRFPRFLIVCQLIKNWPHIIAVIHVSPIPRCNSTTQRPSVDMECPIYECLKVMSNYCSSFISNKERLWKTWRWNIHRLLNFDDQRWMALPVITKIGGMPCKKRLQIVLQVNPFVSQRNNYCSIAINNSRLI